MITRVMLLADGACGYPSYLYAAIFRDATVESNLLARADLDNAAAEHN